MNLITKITIITLTLLICSSFVFKNIGERKSLEIKISFEQEEKSDNQSEDEKLAILNKTPLTPDKNQTREIPEEKISFTEFKPPVPTSPPNS